MESNRKRGRETWNAISYRRKRQVMTSMTLNNDDDDVYQIGYEWENTKDFMGTEECYQDDESGASVGAGVFDFPWLKGSKDASFEAEIDECLNSTFATPTPTTSFCNYYDDHEINIDTTATIATASLISCDNTFNRKNLLFQLDSDHDFNFDLDLIDQFFTDNSSITTQSSCDDDQLRVNKIENQQLKTEENDDYDQLKVNKIEDQQLKTEANDDEDQLKVDKIEDQQLKIEANDDDDQLKVNKIEHQQLKIEVNDDNNQLKVNKIEEQQLKT